MDSNYEPPPNFQGPKDDGAPPGDPIEMSPELGKIFGELSWTSRLQLLDQYYPTPNKTLLSMNSLMEPMGPKKLDGLTPSPMEPQPQELPSQQTGQLPEFQGGQGPPSQQQRSRRADRKVGMSAMKMSDRPFAGRRQTPSGDYPTSPGLLVPPRDDETSMKLKLFRLMYETVRDSDLKVKRAELIKTQYVNSSDFELGYLIGDITDKYNIMSDIALTLQRLYSEWRPIEHINAYEQIANQAIEISHLVDLVKTVGKRDNRGGNKEN